MIESEHRPTQIRVNLDAIAENFEQVMTNLPLRLKHLLLLRRMLMVMELLR